ncbi:MAG: hypothetical protein IPO22_23040 [Anaerolineales bacterium]|nr:hypothetical protein [Anaerolineales bacterium]
MDILVSKDEDAQRKYLFDTYIEQMFERVTRTKSESHSPEQTKHWLAWLGQKIIDHNTVPYLFENMQPRWLRIKEQWTYRWVFGLMYGLYSGLILGLLCALLGGFFEKFDVLKHSGISLHIDWSNGLIGGLILGFLIGLLAGISDGRKGIFMIVEMVDALTWEWQKAKKWMWGGLLVGLAGGLLGSLLEKPIYGLLDGLIIGLMSVPFGGFGIKQFSQTTYPGQKISLSLRSYLLFLLVCGLSFGLGLVVFYSLFWGK